MLISLDFTTLVANTVESQFGSDGSPYEKRVDARGRESEPVCIEGEIPFEIPEGWEWARLESVTTYIQRGKSPKYSTVEKYPVIAQKCNQWSGFSVEKARFIDPATVSKYADERVLKDGDLLWNSTGLGTLGRMAVYDSAKNRYGWAVADSHVTVIRTREDWLDYRYAFAYFAGPSVQSVIEEQASGSTKQKELAQETVRNYLIPLPPLAEQRRIVERVGELMPLVEEYGELEDAREALDAALPGRLRKSVLQLAVQGGLVPQDPADEPAGVLLERIRGQRRQLVAEGKMRAPKGGESIIFAGSDGRRYEKRVDARGRESEPVCIEGEIPFEIPEGWEWARLESVTTYIQRGKSPKYSTVEKYPVIAQKCNQWSGFSVEKARFIDPATVSKYADERVLKDGDLLWNSTGLGTLGRMAVYDSAKNRYGWAVADSHVTVIRTQEDCLDHRFAFVYFAGPSVQSVIEDQASGSTKQKELAQETVRNYLIPIPPLAEQHRIVGQFCAALSKLTNQ
ncbi:restriction endonuclease subunit S [Collinsella aerofaciens]|uniref:restriction endonuclease subunit S n=1 Tax=Collinsella aerofaciens TaxID=74426 RepID=UPI0034A458EC